jgi:hypothetical protein
MGIREVETGPPEAAWGEQAALPLGQIQLVPGEGPPPPGVEVGVGLEIRRITDLIQENGDEGIEATRLKRIFEARARTHMIGMGAARAEIKVLAQWDRELRFRLRMVDRKMERERLALREVCLPSLHHQRERILAKIRVTEVGQTAAGEEFEWEARRATTARVAKEGWTARLFELRAHYARLEMRLDELVEDIFPDPNYVEDLEDRVEETAENLAEAQSCIDSWDLTLLEFPEFNDRVSEEELETLMTRAGMRDPRVSLGETLAEALYFEDAALVQHQIQQQPQQQPQLQDDDATTEEYGAEDDQRIDEAVSTEEEPEEHEEETNAEAAADADDAEDEQMIDEGDPTGADPEEHEEVARGEEDADADDEV